MPQPRRNNPDMVDVQNMLHALGEDYGVIVRFTITVRGDLVEAIGKSYEAPYTPDAKVVHVALASWPVQVYKDIPAQLYLLAFDIWCQHDGAGATAARRGPTYSWQGRVEVPRRRVQR